MAEINQFGEIVRDRSAHSAQQPAQPRVSTTRAPVAFVLALLSFLACISYLSLGDHPHPASKGCEALATSCLVAASLTALNQINTQQQSYRILHQVGPLATLMQKGKADPRELLNSIRFTDDLYRIVAIADIYSSDPSEALRVQLIDEVSRNTGKAFAYSYVMPQMAGALSAIGQFSLFDKLFPDLKSGTPAILLLRRGISQFGQQMPNARATLLEGAKRLQKEFDRGDDYYEALRSAFQAIAICENQNDDRTAQDLIALLPSYHRIVGKAIVAAMKKQVSTLQALLLEAATLPSDKRNYVLHEIALAAAKAKARGVYDQAISHMSDESSNQQRTDALALGAVLFGDYELISQAQYSLSKIPYSAGDALSDGLASIAEADSLLGHPADAWTTINKISQPYIRIEAITRASGILPKRYWRILDIPLNAQ